MSLQKALLLLVALVLLAGLVPAGILMDRRLESALEARARRDLALAPRVLADRLSMQADARMMHAKDAAGIQGLARALASGDSADAMEMAREGVVQRDEEPLLLDADGASLLGPTVEPSIVEEARGGAIPVALTGAGDALRTVALSRVTLAEETVGFVGVWTPVGQGEAGTLAGLTRSDVLIGDGHGRLAAFTGDSLRARALLEAAGASGDEVREVAWRDRRYLVASAPWGPARVTFVRSLEEELGVLPQLRRIGAVSLALALLFGAAVGGVFAAALGRPVRALATAAGRVAKGDFDAPVPTSAVKEVGQVAEAFRVMREALASRLDELERANQQLEERQRRLSALQAELIQRDRLAAAGRLLTQLAHEIRNPVASVRNCLELLRRRAPDDESREFADLAIDELLRMHELAEQMLDLHRPRDPADDACDAGAVVREIATLVGLGIDEEDGLEIRAVGAEEARCRISAEALKQVLLNMVQNAREALQDRGVVEIAVQREDDLVAVEVRDDGPGVADDLVDRIFDPFYTTKKDVQGVGLGLFIAEATVRRHGGRVTASNRDGGAGAVFRIELPAASPDRTSGAEAGAAAADSAVDEAGDDAGPGGDGAPDSAAAGDPTEGGPERDVEGARGSGGPGGSGS